jgi:hypothetical protein
LLSFQKEDLIEEVVKLMYCLKSMEKKKEKELAQFKEEERKRYE